MRLQRALERLQARRGHTPRSTTMYTACIHGEALGEGITREEAQARAQRVYEYFHSSPYASAPYGIDAGFFDKPALQEAMTVFFTPWRRNNLDGGARPSHHTPRKRTMIHDIPYDHWPEALAQAIENATDGDTIICHTETMIVLAERARQRMCPLKSIVFQVEEAWT